MKLVFLDTIPWDYDVATPFEQPLGGSQSALSYLAVALAQRGHQVTLVSGTTRPRDILGVTCLTFAKLPAVFWKQPYDAFVVLNGPSDRGVQFRTYLDPATPLVLWTTNSPDQVSYQPLRQRAVVESWDAIVCVSAWHRQTMIQHFSLEPERVYSLANAIAPAFEGLFASAEALGQAKGSQPFLAYTSAPFRGLDVLLDVFPAAHASAPQAELRVYSSMQIYRLGETGDPFAPLYQRCRTLAGVNYVGSLRQPQLAEVLCSASILTHPSTFPETSCISVLEAMAAGLFVVTSDLGALPETCRGFAKLVPSVGGGRSRAEFCTLYLQALNEALREHARDPVSFASSRFAQVQAINAEWTWIRRALDWERAVGLWKEALVQNPSSRPASSGKPLGDSQAPLTLSSSPISWYSAAPGAMAVKSGSPSPPKSQQHPNAPPASSSQPATTESEPWLKVTASPHLTTWLAEQRVGLACTSRQTGKLFLIGHKTGGELAIFERSFAGCRGLWSDGQTIWMSSLYQLWRLENTLRPGVMHQDHDRLYIPRECFISGDLSIHDIVAEPSGRVVFAATGFNCLATIHQRQSFTPLWRPAFVSKITAEDRCHLNGLGMVASKPSLSSPRFFATAASTTDNAGAWRDQRRTGGVVLEVPTSNTVASGLSLPCSPRWQNGQLWLLNSGTGYLGKIDLGTGRFEPVTLCSGYPRGLALTGDCAIVSVSQPRHDRSHGSLRFAETLATRGVEAYCGLQVIDLRTGTLAHWLRLEGLVTELNDVVVLPGVVRPMALGFATDEIQRLIAIGNEGVL
jgi:uncharacterized protein (TIGR03032 family)